MRKFLALATVIVFVLTGCGASTPTVAETPQAAVPDIDLTSMSSTVVYSQVYDMMYSPETYLGKTIRMRGRYTEYTNFDQSQFFPACVIDDATACCSQGIEFVTASGSYPKNGDEVTVEGVFCAYVDESDGQTYYHLENAVLK